MPRALVVGAGLILLGSCAQRTGEETAAPSQGQPPAYEYEAPRAETSPLLYEPADGEQAPSGTSDRAYRLAAEQCHNYARAIVNQDRRISHDRDARRSGQMGASRTFSLTRSMATFGERGSYDRHFSSCMEGRGFEPEQ